MAEEGAAPVPEAPAPGSAETVPDGQNTAEQAPAPPPEGGTPEKPPEKAGQSRYERRLDKAYRKAAEATGRADFLEQRLKELTSPRPAASLGEPRIENFSDMQEFVKARDAFVRSTTLKEHTESQQAQVAQASQRRLVDSWESNPGREKYEDFDEVVGDLKPTTPWAVAIMQAENGADIAHYLGTNLKEAHRIIALDPLSQVREIGKLETKLLLQAPTPKAVSKAPAPITPGSGTGAPVEAGLRDGMSYKDFVRVRNKQLGRT